MPRTLPSGPVLAAVLLLGGALPAPGQDSPPPGAVPRLEAPAAYEPRDGIVDLELSEYAGYAGLILANGGLGPSGESVFAKRHGFRVRIRLSEEESWSALNAGRMAASATTVDVLAVYGDQLDVVAPAQIGWSRGADAVVVRPEVRSLLHLRGRVLAAARFTESDFFLRTLAHEAGVGVHVLSRPGETPRGDSLNLLYTAGNDAAADRFAEDLRSRSGKFGGCVTWEPRVTEIVEASAGGARVLARNTNLLLVADILLVNGGFAREHPGMVLGLVDGLLEGNRRVREGLAKDLAVVAEAFGWTGEETLAALRKVHLSNLPENLAFFSGAIDAGGSYGMLYQSAILAYGPALLPHPVGEDRFRSPAALADLEKAGTYRGQKAEILPIAAAGTAVEGEPLLRKDVRFLFVRCGAGCDPAFRKENDAAADALLRLLRIGAGSFVRVRGLVDNAEWEEAKRSGVKWARTYQEFAGALSRQRAESVRNLLLARGVAAGRVEAVGTTWVSNVGSAVPQNRRVEAEWFPLE